MVEREITEGYDAPWCTKCHSFHWHLGVNYFHSIATGNTSPLEPTVEVKGLEYDDFWKPIVEKPDGTLDKEQVMKELHDYHTLLDNVPKVYCHITHDRISKPNTLADAVISVADDILSELCAETIKDELEAKEDDIRADERAKTLKEVEDRIFGVDRDGLKVKVTPDVALKIWRELKREEMPVDQGDAGSKETANA